ncbi:HFR046Cp [Eremothecium sinecaudum]|uniref:HFR046Cp n=1 Tax=Eremothecium sinecaudum TaxID=45286 RepID=A0A120K2L5_9SACH|nr:HFR046Cp [Eremothecium sinecaudum]AMD21901.1 HFR046Cp [Eremothecium sinecaudum]
MASRNTKESLPSMEVLMRVLTDRQQHAQKIKEEYQRKLAELTELMNALFDDRLQGKAKLDTETLNEKLKTDIDIIERDGKRYALIPITSTKQQRKSHKTVKIACSYCKELGHTRAKCEKRLLNVGHGK